MKKTSKAFFERFKESFLEWQMKLGLTQYEIDFYLGPLDKNVAELEADEMGKLVSVTLVNRMSNRDNAKGPDTFAKHEAIHLLQSRFRYLAGCRYLDSDDLDEEEEAIIRRLEKVLE